MPDELVIEGGVPLCGTIRVAGNKNAVLPMIAAAMLTDEPVVLSNVPDIRDVEAMLNLAEAAGADVDWDRPGKRVRIQARRAETSQLPREVCRRIRAGILFGAPLAWRSGGLRMPPPGGDVIGRRRLEAHTIGLAALGIEVRTGRTLEFLPGGNAFQGGECFLPEPSVTATEHVLLAAAVSNGRTVIRNAACEPHVVDLGRLLSAMGARIEGLGTNCIVVEGCPEGLGGASHVVGPDHTEAGSYAALAAATGGEATITGVDGDAFVNIARAFRRLGVRLEIRADCLRAPREQSRRIQPDPDGGIPVIDDGPWPLLPSDLMSVLIVLATQMHGTVLFFEKMFESRMYFVDRLVAMGANAVICDPHRVLVAGPSRLHGIALSSPDIRAGIALIGAALCARGESRIANIESVDRGYERVEEKLAVLGARVHRISTGV